MGFLDSLRRIFGGGASQPESAAYWIYVQCQRCGEPLKARVDLRNDLSLNDEGGTYIVRKGLLGSGSRRCFQTVEVTLTFDRGRQEVLDRQISGGQFISEEEYQQLLETQAEAEEPGS